MYKNCASVENFPAKCYLIPPSEEVLHLLEDVWKEGRAECSGHLDQRVPCRTSRVLRPAPQNLTHLQEKTGEREGGGQADGEENIFHFCKQVKRCAPSCVQDVAEVYTCI